MIILPSSGIQIQNKTVIQTSRGNTLYVGGNGSGNYTKIQDAIHDAYDGDTVFVYSKDPWYIEWDIQIDKSINLIGEDKNTTIINAVGYNHVLEIINDKVNISGFSISNSRWNGIYGEYVNNIIISDNHFVNCGGGILLRCTNESFIIFNLFKEFDECAVFIDTDFFNNNHDITISNNVIIDTSNEVFEIWGSMTAYNGKNLTIANNTLKSESNAYRRGLYLYGVSDSIIKGNEFVGYDEFAIHLDEAGNSNIIISYNNFTDNSCAIVFGGYWFSGGAYHIKVINNNFIDNHNDAGFTLKSRFNTWEGNYWDTWIGFKYKFPIFQGFPHLIRGGLLSFAIDWYPALEPYDI
jgi:hypothetical protein